MCEFELGGTERLVLGVLAGDTSPDGLGLSSTALNMALPVEQRMRLSTLGGVLKGLRVQGLVRATRAPGGGRVGRPRRFHLTDVGRGALPALTPAVPSGPAEPAVVS